MSATSEPVAVQSTNEPKSRNISRESFIAAYRRVARKRHQACFGDCPAIQPGEVYVESICFPGHDANGGKKPYRAAICAKHALQYGYDVDVPTLQAYQQGLV